MAEILSNPVPFEVLGDGEETARTGIELEVYDGTNLTRKIDILPTRLDPAYVSEMNRLCGGSVVVPSQIPRVLQNPDLLAYRNVVKVRDNRKVVGAWLIKNKTEILVDEQEYSGLAFSVSGPGLRDWFEDADVYPYGGLKLRSPDVRVFSFASEQGSWYNPADWVPASVVAQYNMDPPPGNTSPWGTAPAEWPDAPLACWIWSDSDTIQPAGYAYFRYEFDIPVSVGTKSYSIFCSADDEFDLYVDAGKVASSVEPDTYSQTYRADFDLDPGHHVIAARVRHFETGAAGFIAALFRVGDATENPPIPAQLLTYTGASGWLVNGYPDPAPGWTAGEIMLTLLAEAEARGVRFPSTLVPTFTATHDSEGVEWSRSLDWTFNIGSSYTSVVEKLEELVCDIWIDPDTYELHMTIEQGSRRDVQTTDTQPVTFRKGQNLQRAESQGEAVLKNALIMQTSDGFVAHSDGLTDSEEKYGRLEGFVSGGSSPSVAGDVALAMFKKHAEPQETATYRIVNLKGTRPWQDFFEGDWVLAPGGNGAGLVPRRVMSISLAEDRDTGRSIYELEFDTIFEDRDQRMERWLRATSDGTLDGSVSNSGGGGGTPTPALPLPKTGAPGPEGPPGPPGVVWRGDWSAAIMYDERDAVAYLGSSWIAVADNVGVEPTPSASQWDLIAQGAGIVILGALANTGLLPTSGNTQGDAYLVSGNLWVWNGTAWIDAGPIRGPKGDPGDKGDTGDPGKSAYQIAVDNGFVGSQSAWLASLAGADGDPGPEGDSAYEVAVANGFVGTEAQWLDSLEGPQGPAGPGLVILGELPTSGDLPASGSPGDAYIISGDLWVWNGTSWENVGSLEGPAGPEGKSAYQVAVANGFVGTESAWLASLVGADGDDGTPGSPGPSAYDVAVSNGFVGTQAAWLASLEGADGTPGDDGAPGASAYQVAVANGFVGTEAEWLESLVGPGGVPAGGTTGQVLTKQSNTDGDAVWQSPDEGVSDAAVEDILSTETSASRILLDSLYVHAQEAVELPVVGTVDGTVSGSTYTSVQWSVAVTERLTLTKLRLKAGGNATYSVTVGGVAFGSAPGTTGNLVEVTGSATLEPGTTTIVVTPSVATQFRYNNGAPHDYSSAGAPITVQSWSAFSGLELAFQYALTSEGAGPKSAYDVAVENGFVGTQAEWLASLAGADGDPGPDGDSAYDVAVENGFVGTQAEWLSSLVGADGAPGDDGAPGANFAIKGTLADEASLPASGSAGDAYLIGGELYIWSVLLTDWENVGPFGSAMGGRTTATYTTASLAMGAQETGVVALAPGYDILKIQFDRSARVRLYDTIAHRDADLARAPGTDPATDAGVMLDFSSVSGAGTWGLSPIPVCVNFESGNNVAITVDNLSGGSATVAVSITYRRTE